MFGLVVAVGVTARTLHDLAHDVVVPSEAVPIPSASLSQSRVLPSTSLKRKVTVPVGVVPTGVKSNQ